MADISANPSTLQQIVYQARTGDHIHLLPGPYGSLIIEDIVGSEGRPITISGDRLSVFDGGTRHDEFRNGTDGNAMIRMCTAEALIQHECTRDEIPILAGTAQRGHITIRNSQHIRLEGFSMRGCWPTAIAIDIASSITLDDLAIQAGSVAVHAQGLQPQDLTVRNCSWI